jgi:hypothetical protein
MIAFVGQFTFLSLKEIKISNLRKTWSRHDVRNAQVLRFARIYHGEKFRFLTLTSRREEESSLRDRKRRLFRSLRVQIPSLEYRCTRTEEGNGVCHICLVSPVYIPWRVIEEHWGSYVQISQERNLEALLQEMSLQSDHCQYSMSRMFVPDGVLEAIEALGRLFRGRLGQKSVEMLARRWKARDALSKTIECCSRKDTWHSQVDSRMEILGGRICHV